MAKGLTDRQLQALLAKPPPEETTLADGTIDGLTIRVGPRGKPTWSYRFRIAGAGGVTARGTTLNGRTYHRVSLGRYPAISIKAARETAAHYKAMAERGDNPITSLAEAAIDRRDTVSALVEDYVKWARENIRSWRNAKWSLERHMVPAWGERPVGTITPRDATALVTEVSRGPVDSDTGENSPRPGAGSEVRKWGATIFEWARQRHRVRTNPFSDVAAPRLKRRQRFLRMDEACAVYQAAMTLEAPWSHAIRMLMLTGCRENEICGARWSWLDSNGQMLLVPPEHYKTGRPFMVLLSSQARQILDSIPRLNEGDFIFSTTNGAKPVAGIPRKILDKLHRTAEALLSAQSATPVIIEHFRLHDLRRTVRTHLARLGVSEIVAELVLGHAIKGVQGTYNVYDFAEEKRAALVRWAQELEHANVPPKPKTDI